MPKYAELYIKESLSELKKLQKQTANYRKKTRIQSLILIKAKKFERRSDLASHLGIGLKTLYRWLEVYKRSGIDSMLTISNGGARRKRISSDVHKGLEKKLTDSSSPLLGYWDAVLWVEQNYNEKINYQTLRSYMKRHWGTKLKSPRKSHYKKEEQAIEAFKKTT